MALSPIQSQIALQLTQQKGADLSNIKGVVVAVDGQQVVVAVQGQRLAIAAEALTNAAVGQSLSFALVALGDGRYGLQLKTVQSGSEQPVVTPEQGSIGDSLTVAPDGEEAYKGILKSQLKSFGVEATEANLSIAKAQRGHELPMNKATFLQLKGLHFHLQALNNQLASMASQGISLEGESLQTWLAEPELVAQDLGQRNFGTAGSLQQQPQLVGTPLFGTPTEQLTGHLASTEAAQQAGANTAGTPLSNEAPVNTAPEGTKVGDPAPLTTVQGASVVEAMSADAMSPQARLQAAIAAASAAAASDTTPENATIISKATGGEGPEVGPAVGNPHASQSNSGLVQLPTAHLSGRVQQLLSSMVAEPETLDQTLAFMVKQGIPQNTLNIVITHQFLKGSLGFNAGLSEVLESALSALEGKGHPELSAIRQLLDKVKGQALSWHQWPDTLDGSALREQVTAFGEVAEALRQLSITSEQGEYQSQFDAIKQTAGLSQEGQWTNLWLPQPLGQMLQDVEVYVKRDADKSKPVDPDNALLYIALDTEHLGRVRVKIQTKQASISVVFMIAQDEVRRAFEQQSSTLYTALKKHTDKALHLVFQPSLDNTNLAEFERVGREGLQLFDMWI